MKMKIKAPALALAASILAGALSLVGTAQAVMFSGNTSASSPTIIDTYLTYASTNFANISVPVGPGSTSLTNLGSFTLNVCTGVNCQEPFGSQDSVTDFALRITFTVPTVSGSPELFAGDIYGTICRSGNSNNIGSNSNCSSLLTINFDNTAHHLTYTNTLGSGAFDLSVNDPAAYTSASSFGDTRTVTGQIANLTFTPNDPPDGTERTVPEPSTLLLVGVGLIAVSVVTRSQLREY